MGLRLLYVMVQKLVPRALVFQLDETGVDLLPVSNFGRAEAGSNEVRFHGIDEKRQFTVTPVVDGNGKLLQPSQVIWGGNEFKTVPDPEDPLRRRRFTTDTPATRACPSETVVSRFKEELTHVQTPSHWCTFSTFKGLIASIYAHAHAEMKKVGLDPLSESTLDRCA